MPKGKKHTPEQIVAILRRLESGETAEAVCRSVNVSEATLYRCKQQYGALELSEVNELKALREENARLRRVVADQVLNIQVLKEVNAKNGEPVAEAPRRPRLGRGGLELPPIWGQGARTNTKGTTPSAENQTVVQSRVQTRGARLSGEHRPEPEGGGRTLWHQREQPADVATPGEGAARGAGARRCQRDARGRAAPPAAREPRAADALRDSKKNGGHLPRPIRERFAVILTMKETYPLTVLCPVLGVSRSGYHA